MSLLLLFAATASDQPSRRRSLDETEDTTATIVTHDTESVMAAPTSSAVLTTHTLRGI